jgi:hypothetical protein
LSVLGAAAIIAIATGVPGAAGAAAAAVQRAIRCCHSPRFTPYIPKTHRETPYPFAPSTVTGSPAPFVAAQRIRFESWWQTPSIP